MSAANHTHNQKVSILMPIYNSAEYLAEALDSIILQSYKNWELICVDDGSTDATPKILKKYSKKDSRIKVLTLEKNYGLSFALNKALELATGKYIARMDSDDISLPTRLEKQVGFLNRHPKVVAVGTQCELIDSSGDMFGQKTFPTESREIYKMMFQVMSLQHATIMARGDLYKSEGYENQPTAEDVSLCFRLLRHGNLANLDEALYQYRINRGSNSLGNIREVFLITFKTRLRAISEWGYKPSVYSVIINVAQFAVVMLLPSKMAMAIYKALRFKKTQ